MKQVIAAVDQYQITLTEEQLWLCCYCSLKEEHLSLSTKVDRLDSTNS